MTGTVAKFLPKRLFTHTSDASLNSRHTLTRQSVSQYNNRKQWQEAQTLRGLQSSRPARCSKYTWSWFLSVSRGVIIRVEDVEMEELKWQKCVCIIQNYLRMNQQIILVGFLKFKQLKFYKKKKDSLSTIIFEPPGGWLPQG